MALTVGDMVTPTLQHDVANVFSRTVFGPGVLPQPPIVGRVTDAAAANVFWTHSGILQATIPPASLDILLDPDANEVTRLQGRIVRVLATVADWSPEYQFQVISLYKRDLAGAGGAAITSTLALLLCLATGAWYEIQSDQLEPTAGR
jgi:hypothetical protein